MSELGGGEKANEVIRTSYLELPHLSALDPFSLDVHDVLCT